VEINKLIDTLQQSQTAGSNLLFFNSKTNDLIAVKKPTDLWKKIVCTIVMFYNGYTSLNSEKISHKINNLITKEKGALTMPTMKNLVAILENLGNRLSKNATMNPLQLSIGHIYSLPVSSSACVTAQTNPHGPGVHQQTNTPPRYWLDTDFPGSLVDLE